MERGPRRIERPEVKPLRKKTFSGRLARLVAVVGFLGMAEPAFAKDDRTLDQQCGLDPVELIALSKTSNEIIKTSMKDVAFRLVAAQEITGQVVETIVTDEAAQAVTGYLVPPFAEYIQHGEYIKASDYTDKYNCLYGLAGRELNNGDNIRKVAKKFLQDHLPATLSDRVWEAIERDLGQDKIEDKLHILLDNSIDIFYKQVDAIMTADLTHRIEIGNLTHSKADQEYILYFGSNKELSNFLKNDQVRQWFVDLVQANIVDEVKDKQTKDLHSIEWNYSWWTEKLPGLQTAVHNNAELHSVITQRLLRVNDLSNFSRDLGYAKEIIQFTPDQKSQLVKHLDTFGSTTDLEHQRLTQICKDLLQ